MRTLAFASFASIILLGACAPPETEEAVAAESELGAAAPAMGIVATDGQGYVPSSPNVARELEEIGAADVPGVLRAASSTSPYAYAAWLELSVWSSVSTTSWDGDASPRLFVRVEGPKTTAAGRAADAIFGKMTDPQHVTETTQNGALVRRSEKGSVTCARYTGHTQCWLGPFDHVASR